MIEMGNMQMEGKAYIFMITLILTGLRAFRRLIKFKNSLVMEL